MNRILATVPALFAAMLAVTGTSWVAAAHGAGAADFYRGETVTLVVGYGAGGGYDTYARLLAPWLERRTGATVVVENRTGGGGLVALNQVFDQAGDGLTLMLVNGSGAVMAQLLAIEGVRFDLLDMPILGRLAAESSVIMLSKRSTFASFDELNSANARVKWSGGGKTDSIADSAACVSEALGLDSRIIIGYKGSKESALAAMRGEVDAVITTASTAASLSAGGELTPVAVIDRERTETLPDVPTLFERTTLDESSAWWIDFWADIAAVGRTLVTSPGTPGSRVDYLRDIVAGIVSDPGFIADVHAAKRLIRFLDAPAIEALMEKTLATLPATRVAQVRAVVLEKFYR